jgi:hypothetical protein
MNRILHMNYAAATAESRRDDDAPHRACLGGGSDFALLKIATRPPPTELVWVEAMIRLYVPGRSEESFALRSRARWGRALLAISPVGQNHFHHRLKFGGVAAQFRLKRLAASTQIHESGHPQHNPPPENL